MSRHMTPAERDELMAKAAVAALRDETFSLDDPSLSRRLREAVLQTSRTLPGFAVRFLSATSDKTKTDKTVGGGAGKKVLVRVLKEIALPAVSADRKSAAIHIVRQAIVDCCNALETGTSKSLLNANRFAGMIRKRVSIGSNNYAVSAAKDATSKKSDAGRALVLAAHASAVSAYHASPTEPEASKAHRQAWDAAFRLIADIIIEEVSR